MTKQEQQTGYRQFLNKQTNCCHSSSDINLKDTDMLHTELLAYYPSYSFRVK